MTTKLTATDYDRENRWRDDEKHRKALGHKWMLTVQDRYGETPEVPESRAVWVACTCGRWASNQLPTVEAALEAYETHRGTK